jgi:hypothetical protein
MRARCVLLDASFPPLVPPKAGPQGPHSTTLWVPAFAGTNGEVMPFNRNMLR